MLLPVIQSYTAESGFVCPLSLSRRAKLPLQHADLALRSLQSLKLSESCALSKAEVCIVMEPNLTADLHFD